MSNNKQAPRSRNTSESSGGQPSPVSKAHTHIADTSPVVVVPATVVAAPILSPVKDSSPIDEVASGDKLKHLGFVNDVAASASASAGAAYNGARPYVPAVVEPYVAKVEEHVAAYTAPVVAKATEVVGQVLTAVDQKASTGVDYVHVAGTAAVANGKDTIAAGQAHVSGAVTSGKTYLEGTYDLGKTTLSNGASTLKDYGTAGVSHLQTATTRYLDFLKERSAWLADKVSPTKNVTRARETLLAAIAAVDHATEPDIAIGRVQAAWDSFVAIPAVKRVLSVTEPVTNYGTSSFVKAHATLVGSPYYSKAVELGGSTLGWAASTTPYTLSAKFLYPLVAPVADPALSKITRSTKLYEAAAYWKPAAFKPAVPAVVKPVVPTA